LAGSGRDGLAVVQLVKKPLDGAERGKGPAADLPRRQDGPTDPNAGQRRSEKPVTLGTSGAISSKVLSSSGNSNSA
jgi:hypothetical protein